MAMKSVFTCMLLAFLSRVQAAQPSAAMDFRGMEENCILSFVVPRDKVKSSCDVEERVRRRLNAMETKVALYKQHMQELEQQLDKERELHRQSLQDVHQRLAQTEPRMASMDNVLMEKRIFALEEEVRKIRMTVVAASPKASQPSGLGEKPHSRGLGQGMAAGRTREEQEKAMTNLVKTVVHSEVKKLFDNYTQYVGRYVRDQALAFNQVMNMVPRRENVQNLVPRRKDVFHEHNLPPKWPDSMAGGGHTGLGSTTPGPVDRDMQLLNELEGIRNRLNSTGSRLVDRMRNVLNKVNVSSPTTRTVLSVDEVTTVAPDAPIARDSGLLDINDTASGDTNDTAGDQNVTLLFTQLANSSASVDMGPSKYLQLPKASGSSSASSAQSRMSYNSELNKLPDPAGLSRADGDEVDVVSEGDRNDSGWDDSMQHDRSSGQWIQNFLRTEMQLFLQHQVDEMVTLVSKHSSLVDTKLHDQETKFNQLEERLAADIKHLDQVVSGLKLEMTSVSQGLQTLYSRWEKAEELEATVMELKRNMSVESGSRLLATMLDEQAKKVRKLERLTGIYKQSLEHYRNESKLEYRDLRERMDKESNLLKGLHAQLFHNVSEHAKQLSQRVNASAFRQTEEIKQRVQVMEDNTLLLQIDLSNFERQVKSRTGKLERDVTKLTQDNSEFKHKARNLQKNVNMQMAVQEELSQAVNASSAKVQQLQMEVKLNLLDHWYPYPFHYMKTRTDCFGEQFVRKSGFQTGRLVGVVLCSHKRYKIFLGQDFTDTFKNIGDDSGMGEDHCQFVKARSMSKVKVSPFRTSPETEPGYVRTHWGQEPRTELLNIIRPSPSWYECGVSIP